MRSKLFVRAHGRAVCKALAGEADAISLDLEEGRKAEAEVKAAGCF